MLSLHSRERDPCSSGLGLGTSPWCCAGFPRTLGILYDPSVFCLVGCMERSSFSLLSLVFDVRQVEDVPCTCAAPTAA